VLQDVALQADIKYSCTLTELSSISSLVGADQR